MEKDFIIITKANGDSSVFVLEKLLRSLKKAGASEEIASVIGSQVMEKIYKGITTKEIYSIAFGLLKNYSRPLAARYHLKTAIMELGPSGFPFEKYVATILNYQGYAVKIDVLVDGKCVTHEIDVIAEKENDVYMVECKYHNNRGTICDVKIPLYIHSRFKDVEAVWLELPEHKGKNHKGWLFTNTKFSGDAIQYGMCAGLKLVGWNYPDNDSLRHMVDELCLYPITCITSLTRKEKAFLLNNHVVLCKDICDQPAVLATAGISEARNKTIIAEATVLSKNLHSI